MKDNNQKAQAGLNKKSAKHKPSLGKATSNAVQAHVIGGMLNKIPFADTAYDMYNVYDALQEGDPMKIAPNVMGALIPGVSGKIFESFANEYAPKTPEAEKKKFRDVMNGKRASMDDMRKVQEQPIEWRKAWDTLTEDFQDGGNISEAAGGYNITRQNTVDNLRNTGFNRAVNATNSLGDPRNGYHQLPNTGILGQIKAAAGIAAGVSGAVQGYNKMFAPDSTYTPGQFASHQNDFDANAGIGYDYQAPGAAALNGKSGFDRAPYDDHFAPAPAVPQGFGRRAQSFQPHLPDAPITGPYHDQWSYDDIPEAQFGTAGVTPAAPNFFTWYQANSGRPDVQAMAGNQAAVMAIFKRETSTPNGFNSEGVKTGDSKGMQMAMNSINGLGMANQALGAQDYERQYNERLRDMGNTDAKYLPQNAQNPFGNFTPNTGAFANQALIQGVPVQDFGTKMAMAQHGGSTDDGSGEYDLGEDEIQALKDQGYEIEYLD